MPVPEKSSFFPAGKRPRRAFQNSSELPMMGILVKISRSRSNSFKEAVKAGPYSRFYPYVAKSQATKQAALLRLDRAQMTAYRQPGPDPAQGHAAKEQRQRRFQTEPRQIEFHEIKPRQLLHRSRQPENPDKHQDPGQNAATQAIPKARIEEGAPHEGVGPAHQLDNHDLLAPVLDVETNGITHHQQHRRRQHDAQRPGQALDQGHQTI